MRTFVYISLGGVLSVQSDRYSEWIDASIGAGAIEPFMIPLVQGLGRVDCELIRDDRRFTQLPEAERSSVHESTLLTDRFTLSYLWVLGAYELIRTLDQRRRTNPGVISEPFSTRITGLKHSMERLRIPLAKMEPSRRYPSDSPIAYPALSRDFGIAWHVAANTFISRRELSDSLLSILTDMKAHLPATTT